jgi:hypothetical protein
VTVAGRVLSVTCSSDFFAPYKMIVISDVSEELVASTFRFTEFSRIKMLR